MTGFEEKDTPERLDRLLSVESGLETFSDTKTKSRFAPARNVRLQHHKSQRLTMSEQRFPVLT
jgi:hypothetical protein